MSINLSKNIIKRNKTAFNLDAYRLFLLKFYPDLCANLFVKSIEAVRGGEMHKMVTYDWQTIFSLADELKIEEIFFEKYGEKYSIIEKEFYDKNGNLFKEGDRVPIEFLNKNYFA